MKTMILKLSAFVLIFTLMGAGCKKEHKNDEKEVTIMLYDKPLSVIQHYITGNWKFQYSYGGLATHKIINTDNSYINLSPNHITMGNNLGITVDAPIVWARADVGGNIFTYLLSFPPEPIPYIVYQIKDDTLILRDYNVPDGFHYYYTKN